MSLRTIGNAFKKPVIGLSAAAIIALPTIAHWEGVRYEPYLDIGGVPTVCYGHTGDDIVMNKVYTHEECVSLLKSDVQEHERGMNQYIKVELPEKTKAAFISFTFNVGVNAFKNSTLLRLANAGDLEGACNQLSRWVFVKGVRVRGLLNRRISEKGLCLEGLEKNPWWGV